MGLETYRSTAVDLKNNVIFMKVGFMQTQTFEPMSLGKILDNAIAIYRKNFIRYTTIVAIIQIPISLVTIFVSTLSTSSSDMPFPDYSYQTPIAQITPSDDFVYEDDYSPTAGSTSLETISYLNILVAFIAGIGYLLSNGALVKNVSEYYLGNTLTIGQTYRFVIPKLLTMIIAMILMMIIIMFGFVLLIVPGIIFSLWFALTIQVIMAENLGPIEGLSRSKNLAKGNLGKIFAVSFVANILATIVGGMIGGLVGFIGGYVWSFNSSTFNIILHLAELFANVITMPFVATALILLYYDLRIRKEGFDLEMMAQQISNDDNETDGPAASIAN